MQIYGGGHPYLLRTPVAVGVAVALYGRLLLISMPRVSATGQASSMNYSASYRVWNRSIPIPAVTEMI